MKSRLPVTIVGGGIAGLTLGLLLRRDDVPVVVHESQAYPRHRVCGEFLHGRGRIVLRELGLEPVLVSHGARMGRSAAFFSGGRAAGRAELPEGSLCLSRYRLDQILAEALVSAGGSLKVGERVAGRFWEEGWVRATGRTPKAEDGGWRWVGLKVHALGARLVSDLEMHFLPDAYVGLCAVEGGRVNVCGLFRSRTPLADLRNRWESKLRGAEGSCLRARLQGVDFDEESFVAVAGLPLGGGIGRTGPEGFCVGEARGMIPPVTGNGMSLALESAALAAPILSAWSRGERTWEAACRDMDAACGTAFDARLRWARRLQAGVLHPVVRRLWALLSPSAPVVWRMFYARTR